MDRYLAAGVSLLHPTWHCSETDTQEVKKVTKYTNYSVKTEIYKLLFNKLQTGLHCLYSY